VETVPAWSWRLSFDASSHLRPGASYAEWAWVLETASGARLASDHGPAITEPLSNIAAEWEGLTAGLAFLADGRVGGAPGLRIEGDEVNLIRQLHARHRCRAPLAYWRGECLKYLASLARPWSAAKVGRGENAGADGVAGGGW
jgi:ribonuclease HI